MKTTFFLILFLISTQSSAEIIFDNQLPFKVKGTDLVEPHKYKVYSLGITNPGDKLHIRLESENDGKVSAHIVDKKNLDLIERNLSFQSAGNSDVASLWR